MSDRKPGYERRQADVAEALGVSTSLITKWFADGCPGRDDDGYHLPTIIRWDLERKSKSGGRPAVDDDDQDWDTIGKRELALTRRIRREQLEGTLIERAVVEDMLAQRAAEITNGLRNVEHSAAPDLAPAMDPLEAERVLRSHHDALLEQYARPLPKELTEGANDSAEEDEPPEAGGAKPRKRGRPKGARDKRPRRRRRVE